MTARKYAKTSGHRDDNHDELVDVFQRLGCSVFDTSAVGSGFTDLVIGLQSTNVLVEVKDGKKAPSRRKLNKMQQEFMDSWRGWYEVVESVDDVLKLVAKIRAKKNPHMAG